MIIDNNRIYRSCKECILCVDNDGGTSPHCLEGYLSPSDVYEKYQHNASIQCIRNLTRKEYDLITDNITLL